MNHIEVTVECADERRREILLAELADFPFESFCEEADCLKAYIREADYRRTVARIDGYLKKTGYRYRSETIEDRNWNELWESNFEPIDIEGKCRIRAPFHPKNPAAEYELVIMPKMAFGTGHHATTYLMGAEIIDCRFDGQRGLDMGSGTGVLAMLAVLRGAERVDAVDIDDWAYRNASENIADNGMADRIRPLLGDRRAIEGKRYDYFPMDQELICSPSLKPIYEELPGWEGVDISDCKRFEDLPQNAQVYVQYLEDITGVPASVIAVGPDRDQTIFNGWEAR